MRKLVQHEAIVDTLLGTFEVCVADCNKRLSVKGPEATSHRAWVGKVAVEVISASHRLFELATRAGVEQQLALKISSSGAAVWAVAHNCLGACKVPGTHPVMEACFDAAGLSDKVGEESRCR